MTLEIRTAAGPASAVNHGLAGSAVPSAAVAEASDVSDEDLVGAKGVSER